VSGNGRNGMHRTYIRHVSCVSIVSTADGCGGDTVRMLEVIPSDVNDLNDHGRN